MFVRFVHVLAWMNRFIDNCRLKRGESRGRILCTAEIEDAEITIIKLVQKNKQIGIQESTRTDLSDTTDV